MSERVVSVKMPASLLQELKRLTEEQHYIDVSEQVRSVVRRKCMKYLVPLDEQKLSENISQKIKDASAEMKKEQLLQELSRMLKEEKK